jgi:hypothetical protein
VDEGLALIDGILKYSLSILEGLLECQHLRGLHVVSKR